MPKQVTYPMDNGIVRSWDDMKIVWEHTWEKLEIDPTECKVLLTEPPMNPNKNRERLMTEMFEVSTSLSLCPRPSSRMSILLLFCRYGRGPASRLQCRLL